MSIVVIHSPLHGELTVRASADSGDPARPWRAVLVDPPARLRHLLGALGVTEDEAVRVLAREVERYDAHGVVPRRRVP